MRYQIEFVIFCLFLACIPHFLAPENILYGIFTLVWLINRATDKNGNKNWGGPWRWFDSVIVIWILTDLIINGVNSLQGHGFSGGFDLLRYTSVLWMVSRTKYSPKQIITLMIIAVLTTVAGIPFAYHAYLKAGHDITHFYFKALGERNHTAIFMDLVLGLGLSFLLAFWQKLAWALRIISIVLLGLICFGLLIDASRAGFGAAFVIVFVLGVIYWWRSRAITGVLLGLLVIAGVATFVMHPFVLQRQEVWQQNLEKTGSDARECIWHSAWLTFEQSPIVGFGSHNYRFAATPENIQKWSDEKYQNQPNKIRPCYGFAPHAHNVYFTTLAETGLIGFAGLILFLVSWLVFLIKSRPGFKSTELYWALWGAALCAWFTDVGIGFVNTTLHHEHALMSMMILGLVLSCFYNAQKEH